MAKSSHESSSLWLYWLDRSPTHDACMICSSQASNRHSSSRENAHSEKPGYSGKGKDDKRGWWPKRVPPSSSSQTTTTTTKELLPPPPTAPTDFSFITTLLLLMRPLPWVEPARAPPCASPAHNKPSPAWPVCSCLWSPSSPASTQPAGVRLACYPSSSPMFRSHFLCFFFSPFFFVPLSIFFFLSSFLSSYSVFFLWGDAPFSMNWAPRFWCFFATHCVGTKLLQLILFSLASEYVFDCFFGFFANFVEWDIGT